jgi:ribonuclease R
LPFDGQAPRSVKDTVKDAPPQPPRFAEQAGEKVREFCAEPRSMEDVAGLLKVEPGAALKDWLESLVFAGLLQRRKGKRYQTVTGAAAVGVFRQSRGRGHAGGYVVPRASGLETIDIPPGMEEGAQEGDLVLASYRHGVRKPGRRSQDAARGLTGRVLNIIDARPTEAVGVFQYAHTGRPRVRLEGYNLPRFGWLPPHEAHRTKPGTVVRVRLLRKPDSQGRTRAELLGSVGSIDDPTHDLDNLVALFDFPGDFSEAALAEATALPEHPDPSEFDGRVDLRDLPIITIDPKDAKDHDDAISIEELPGGLVRLGVHIADVSRYVTPGSALDEDARFRATSVYLPGRLIPMLPQQLSAGLCSLHDSVDRLTKSALLTFNDSGEVVRREVVNSVVRVRRFLTYEEVLPVLEGKASSGDDVVDRLLRDGRALADRLQRRRMARGALVLEIPRPHVLVNAAGLVAGIEEEKSDPAHNLIEEFMLAANEAVAHFLLERGLPYIGRIHPAPDEDAKEDFREFCEELRLPKPDFDTPGAVQKFLDSVKSRPGYDAIHYALLRSMTRAVYHAGPELHYALAVRKYVHFTSPIRRYPDTITHQVLSAYLATGQTLRWESEPLDLPWVDGVPSSEFRVPRSAKGRIKKHGTRNTERETHFEQFEFAMPHVAAHCTERSIRADRGELAADQIKILRTLIPRIGEAMHGTVISMQSNAAVVRLDENLAEGYLEFSELTDGWVEVHKFWAHYETHAGVRKIMLGDRMEVELASIDLGSRSLRLTPLGEHAQGREWSRFRARGRKQRR